MRPPEPSDPRLATRVALMLGLRPEQVVGCPPDLLVAMAAHLNTSNRRIQSLVNSSSTDELTGLLRRGPGLDALEREVQRSRRSGDELVVAFVDVDGLKQVNDRDGHAAGDQLLKAVAQTLTGNLRVYDLVIRWGGDEFVCVLPQAGLEGAARLVEALEQDFGRLTGRTLSVGLAELGQVKEEDGARELIQLADSRLYAKRGARESVRGRSRLKAPHTVTEPRPSTLRPRPAWRPKRHRSPG